MITTKITMKTIRQKLLTILAIGASWLLLASCGDASEPASASIEEAVRATLTALPPPTAQVVEVTRIVEVTVVPTAQALLTPNSTRAVITTTGSTTVTTTITPTIPTSQTLAACPTSSGNQYATIPLEVADTAHPDNQHGDLNLALRGYVPTNATLALVDLGAVGSDPPQLRGLFADGRPPTLTVAYRVHDWDWGCGPHGCAKNEVVESAQVSAVAIATQAGERINFPSTNTEIYQGGYVAVVLYAEATRLTLAYTAAGTVAGGYSVHLEGLCVDPNLLAAYQAGNAGGRKALPGLHKGEMVGVASGANMIIAMRSDGTFLDPRSQGDWWR
jgi:hypothetical protein